MEGEERVSPIENWFLQFLGSRLLGFLNIMIGIITIFICILIVKQPSYQIPELSTIDYVILMGALLINFSWIHGLVYHFVWDEDWREVNIIEVLLQIIRIPLLIILVSQQSVLCLFLTVILFDPVLMAFFLPCFFCSADFKKAVSLKFRKLLNSREGFKILEESPAEPEPLMTPISQ